MATEKISATVDKDVVEQIRAMVGPRGVSSFLTEAAREKLQRARILAYLDSLDAEHGPPNKEDEKRAEKMIRRVLEP